MPVIIELNGLPGCGKTMLRDTVCSRCLTVKSVGVAQFRGEGKPAYWKFLLKIVRFLDQFTLSNLGLYFDLRRIIREAEMRKDVAFCNSYENMITVMYIIYLYHTYRKQGGTSLIADEGIIQSLTSWCAQMKIEKKYIEAVLQRFQSVSERMIVVNCECAVETSLKRIRGRNRNDSAMDHLNYEQLQIFLEHYCEQLSYVRSVVGNMCLKMLLLNVEDGELDPAGILEKRIEEYL